MIKKWNNCPPHLKTKFQKRAILVQPHSAELRMRESITANPFPRSAISWNLS